MRCLALAFLLCFGLLCKAQKYDNVWVYGIHPELQNQSYLGNGQLEFKPDSLLLTSKFRNSSYNLCMLSLSNYDGNLMVHSNGLWILDSLNQIIENGDSLNYGTTWEYAHTSNQLSYALIQGMHAIPISNNDSSFYILHEKMTFDGSYFNIDSLCYSKLIQENNGHLKLSKKNVLLTATDPPVDGNLISCKHGNGRDWWVAYVKKNTNCIY